MTYRVQRAKRGRPEFDITAHLYAHMKSLLDQGLNLSESARLGFEVYGYDENSQLVRKRHLKGRHLQAEFRACEKELTPPVMRADRPAGLGEMRFMGSKQRCPIGAAVPSERKRGRPKNFCPKQK